MSRLIMAGAVALAAFTPLAPAIAQPGDYYYSDSRYRDTALEPSITVTAPRMRTEGRSSSGAPIRRVETDSVAYIGDLDLRTSEGRRMLDRRVEAAASEACDFLDQHYGSVDDTPGTRRECRNNAVDSAQLQVRDAVERSAMAEYGGDYYRGY